jgi:hypothetical protein
VLQLLQYLFRSRLIQPVLKPLTRLFLGLIAVPIFRFLMRKVVRMQDISDELEKDLELWFRGSLLLLIATANMEESLFGWIPYLVGAVRHEAAVDVGMPWYVEAGRILLAIGVIEGMPDQSLFALIHPGPSKPVIEKGHVVRSLIRYMPQLVRGLICQHLNRSSPVLAILSVLHAGRLGWVCYGIAITQYLIIGLVASKDKAFDVLSQIDAAMLRQRNEFEAELELKVAARKAAEKHLKSMDPHLESL